MSLRCLSRRRYLGTAFALLVSVFSMHAAEATVTPPPPLARIVERNHVPALATARVDAGGHVTAAVWGVRKVGDPTSATLSDEWHLGSDTKAMTATLIGILVDEGKLTLDTTLGAVFPEFTAAWPKAIREITIAQLLAHRAGLPHDAEWRALSTHGSLVEQRREVVKALVQATDLKPAGKQFEYSNWGYVILGAVAEKVTARPWEELMQARVFAPLEMTHMGFGGTGTPGQVNEPWPHIAGKPTPANGPNVDNPPVMAPAGCAHGPIGDWARFVAHELRGFRGEPTLLKPATFARLHTPDFGGDYAAGWRQVSRAWAGGAAYTHAGSNTMNYCVAWLAPARNVAFLACTNDGSGAKACDEAVAMLLKSEPK